MGSLLVWSRAEIRRSWGSLLAVAILIAIAGGAVMAGIAGARRAGTAVDRFVGTADLASVVVYTESEPEGALRELLASDDRIEYAAEGPVLALSPTGVRPGLEGGTWAMPPTAIAGARTPILLEGRLPAGAGEIAVDASTATRLGFDVGDRVELQAIDFATCFGDPECEVIPAPGADLVGIVRTDQDIVADPNGWTLLIATDAVVEEGLLDMASMGWITSIWTLDGIDPDDLVATYAPLIDNGDMTNDADRVSGALSGAYRAGDLERDAVLAAAAVAAVASLAIIGQAHARFLSRRRSDVDALVAMGMTRSERAGAAWLPGIASSVVGALLAVPVAVALSPLFPLRTARTADPDVGIHADLAVLVPGVAFVALVAMAAAFVSAWGWSRPTTPVRSDDVSLAARLAERLRLDPPHALAVRFALEHRAGADRLPARSAIAGSTAAIVVITTALLLTSSVDLALRDSSVYGVTWDLEVGSGTDPAPAAQFVAADDRIASATFVMAGELDVSTTDDRRGSVSVIGMSDLKGRFDHTVLDGRAPVGPGEVAFSTDALRRTGASVGDEVTLSGPAGERNALVVGRIVVATADGSTSNGIVTDLPLLDELGGSQLIAAIDVQPIVLLTIPDPADVEPVRADVEAAGASTENPTRPTEVALLDEVRFVPTYLAVFVAGLGALGAFHALWTTARRRRTDVMVLRALGCLTRDASGVVRWHGVVLSLVALVAGIPLGVIAGRAIWTAIATERDLVVQIDLPWVALAALAAGTIGGAAFVLATVPARSSARRSIGGELRVE